MTGRWAPRQNRAHPPVEHRRVEWNPRGQEWKAATCISENGDLLRIWLDDGGEVLIVERRFTRPIVEVSS